MHEYMHIYTYEYMHTYTYIYMHVRNVCIHTYIYVDIYHCNNEQHCMACTITTNFVKRQNK